MLDRNVSSEKEEETTGEMVCLYCETAASEIHGIITHSLAVYGPVSDTFGTLNLKFYSRNLFLYI